MGYGVAGLNILKQLSKKASVSFFPIGNPELSQEDAEVINSLAINAQTKFSAKAPCVKIWHQFDMAVQVGNGLRCGMPIFELDKFKENETHHLNSLDKIFVCSKWAKEVVLNNTKVKDVSVCPLGVDSETFYPKDSSAEDDATVFFNCGKWEFRKGHDILPEIFNKAFDSSDNVKLVMMNHNPFLKPDQQEEWVSMYRNSKLKDKIFFVGRAPHHNQVADVMRSVDCGIFPSRAEGWNLEAIELMSCAKDVIITNYSAHTEFCNEDNSYLIKTNDLETAYDGMWFKGDGNWAKMGEDQVDQAVEHMRAVHKKKKEEGKIYNSQGVETAQKFSWENSADKILGAIS